MKGACDMANKFSVVCDECGRVQRPEDYDWFLCEDGVR